MNNIIDKILQYKNPVVDMIAKRIASNKAIAVSDITLLLSSVLYVCQESIPGSIIELGCASGDTSVGLQQMLMASHSDKSLHLCDSFDGLPEPTEQDHSPLFDQSGFRRGVFRLSPQVVLDNFSLFGLPSPIIHSGWFNQIEDYPTKLSLSFVDGDFYQSIWDSLEAVYPRTSQGGLIVVHDYNYPSLPGAKIACDEFFRDRPETVLPYADSALIVKGAE